MKIGLLENGGYSPEKMFLIDLEEKRLIDDDEIKESISNKTL